MRRTGRISPSRVLSSTKKLNQRNKSKSTSYAIKKKSSGKVVAHKVGKKVWS